MEGLAALHGGNSIGDGGTSYGPFQLHAGGALPKGKGNAWANSRAGIDYAERQMAKYARGKHGRDAVAAISSGFERPADVPGEIAKAMSYYGHGGGQPGAGGSAVGAAVSNLGQESFKSMVAASLLDASAQTMQGGKPDSSGLLTLAVARKQMIDQQKAAGMGAKAMPAPNGPRGASGSVQWLGNLQGESPGFVRKLEAAIMAVGGTKVRVRSGERSPAHNAAVGGVGHSNHLQQSDGYAHAMDGEVFIPGKGWLPLGVALQQAASKYGLRSGNVPGFYHGGRDPVHVDDGFNQG